MKIDFIVFQGKEFTIEWYFNKNGKRIALEYYENLSEDRQTKAMNLFKLLANIGKIYNDQKFRHEGDQIYVFKPLPDRFFCFFYEGSKITITNAYEKKTNKMSTSEKEKSLRLRDDFIKRYKQGNYYE